VASAIVEPQCKSVGPTDPLVALTAASDWDIKLPDIATPLALRFNKVASGLRNVDVPRFKLGRRRAPASFNKIERYSKVQHVAYSRKAAYHATSGPKML
jgi:hypothetical protein